MKLGVLTQWYDPETGPAALPGVFAREFVKQGHSVSVLTGFPNYPEGKLYPGYRMSLGLNEGKPPLRIRRVPLYPEHSDSASGRIANYGSFAASASVLAGKALSGADAIWVYNSPITVAVPLLVHNRFGRTPTFLHVQDLWPDSLINSGMFPGGTLGAFVERGLATLVRLMERTSAVIGVISPSVKQLILDRHPELDPAKVVYAPNPTNEALFRPSPEIRRELSIRRMRSVTNIVYAGAIGSVQGFETVLDAMELLRSRSDIHLTLVGDGISRKNLESDALARGLTNITFAPRISQEQVPALIAASDAQLVSLAPDSFLEFTTPSKIPSLLASEIPIVAQIAGDGARLLADSGASLLTTPGDADMLAASFVGIAEMSQSQRDKMAKAGRNFYTERLSAAKTARVVTDSLEGVS